MCNNPTVLKMMVCVEVFYFSNCEHKCTYAEIFYDFYTSHSFFKNISYHPNHNECGNCKE